MTTSTEVDLDDRLQIFYCPICMDMFEDASYLRHCGHEFCNSCISRWLSTNNTCPVCRDHADSGDLMPCYLLRWIIMRVNLQAAAESDAAKRLRLKETIKEIIYFLRDVNSEGGGENNTEYCSG